MVEAICSSDPLKVTLKDIFRGRTFAVGSKGPDGDATPSAAARPQGLRDARPARAVHAWTLTSSTYPIDVEYDVWSKIIYLFAQPR